jgi:hypothetical protein
MGIVNIILTFIFILSLLFLIFWIIWRLKHKESKSSLFGEGFPIFFKDIVKKLNPFLIIKKKEKNVGLSTSKSSSYSGGIISIQQESRNGGNVQDKSVTGKKGGRGKKGISSKYSGKIKEKSAPKGGFLIKIKDLDKLAKRIKNKDVAYIFEFLKKENYSLIEKMLLGKKFKSEEEFVEYFKEEFIVFLNSEVTSLKERVSYLRKKGEDLGGLDLKIMSIPLKIRLFSATFSKKDLDKVTDLLEESDKNLKVKEKPAGSKGKTKEGA